jgi:arylsulfatase A-like enzyme
MMYGGFDHLSDEQIPLSVPLSEAGYTTGAFHSNPYLSAEFGYNRGFDTFLDSIENPDFLSKVRRYVSKNLQGPVRQVLSWAHTKTEEHIGVDVGSYYQNATELTDNALKWIETAEEPWFLWIHYMDPHHPYVPPDDHQVFGNTLPQQRGVKLRQQVLQDPDALTKEDWEDLKLLYDSEIRYVDHEIGRLLGEIGDATWLLTADHGEEFYEHGNFGHKNRFYEEHVHVPMVLNISDSAGVHDELVGLNDVPVTLLEEAGIPAPENYQGVHLLEGDREHVLGGWSQNVGREPDKARLMCRTTGGKYILDKTQDTVEFFNLSDDPEERENLHDEVDTTAYENAIRTFQNTIEETSRDTERRVVDNEIEERLQKLGYME